MKKMNKNEHFTNTFAFYIMDTKGQSMKKRFYKVLEVAEILNVSKGTVYNLIKQNKIPYATINMVNNTRYLIPIEQFEQFVQNNISDIEMCKEIT